MKAEIEAKWLEIDHDEFRGKLKKLGAVQTRARTEMVRATFDAKDGSLKKKRGWVRVRDEGDKVTMSYKQVDNTGVDGTKEVSVVVDDFWRAVDFVERLGMVRKSLQETRRESWELDGVEIDLDEWPWLPTFVELEAENEEELKRVAEKLGLQMEDAMHGSVDYVVVKYYDVTNDEVNSWEEIRFGEVPAWLEAKRRKR